MRVTETLDLEKIEKETFRSYQHEDGMWDVFMGLLMVFWALGLLVDSTFVSMLMLVPSAVFIAGRFLITVPRLGRVRFNRRRVDRSLIVMVAVVVAVVVTAGMVALVSLGTAFNGRAGDVMFILMALVIFSIIGYYLEYWRISLWGVLLCVSWVVAVFVDRTVGAGAFVAVGVVAVALGLASLRAFMAKYPVIRADPAAEE